MAMLVYSAQNFQQAGEQAGRRDLSPSLSHTDECVCSWRRQVDYWHGEVRAAVCSCLEWMVHVANKVIKRKREGWGVVAASVTRSEEGG